MRKIIQAVAAGLASGAAALVMHKLIGSPVVPVAAIGFALGMVL